MVELYGLLTEGTLQIIEGMYRYSENNAVGDMNPSLICEECGIHRSTWYSNKDTLLEYNIIRKTRELGNSPMYSLEACNKIVISLIDVIDAIERIEES